MTGVALPIDGGFLVCTGDGMGEGVVFEVFLGDGRGVAGTQPFEVLEDLVRTAGASARGDATVR